ncbi:MAG: hypothetical protein ACLSHC_10245 [Bilophila wadsworthia]
MERQLFSAPTALPSMAIRPLSWYSPTDRASKTVVIPDAMIWASWAKKAGTP